MWGFQDSWLRVWAILGEGLLPMAPSLIPPTRVKSPNL